VDAGAEGVTFRKKEAPATLVEIPLSSASSQVA
jgi:hypothetical protein